MVQLFGREWSRSEISKRVGNLSQLGGARLFEFSDGKARGARGVDVRTGSGLAFTILLDRAMDIGPAEFAGCPLSWQSCTGFAHPSCFLPLGNQWLRTFGGGLFTTCGLQNVGASNLDEGEQLNLHGMITGSPAENVKVDQHWNGDDLDICVEGTIREAAVFGPNLILQRLIWTRLGEKKIFIEDRITNQGFSPSPLLILYHINIGWPLLDESTMLIIPTEKVHPRDEEAEKEKHSSFTSPRGGYREKVFFHELIPDSSGYIQSAVVNPNLQSLCFGIYVKYPQRELPRFTEWKMMGEGTYVLGIEPGNCGVLGRAEEKKRGTLQYIMPGETKTFHLEIGMITTPEELDQISDSINNLLKMNR